jgi:hypothetical protein
MCKLGEVFCALESVVYKIFFVLPLDKKTGTQGTRGKETREKAKNWSDVVVEWRAIFR